MTRLARRSLAAALAALLFAAVPAPPAAAADERVTDLVGQLEALTVELDSVTRLAKRLTRPSWDPAVARALRIAGIDSLEQALARIRVGAIKAVEPLIGPPPPGAVPAAITAALWNDEPGNEWRREVRAVIEAWSEYRRSVRRAKTLRDRLRTSLGISMEDGLRMCPFEGSILLEEDWGDPRGWRTHKGNDINAAEGTRLVAMEQGEVIQMGHHYLGGNGLFIRGDTTGDVYYYAHLSAYADGIEVGAPVLAGQVVAYVGSTGNSDVPHLHLGWMPGAGRVDLDALTDAYDLLRGLCG